MHLWIDERSNSSSTDEKYVLSNVMMGSPLKVAVSPARQKELTPEQLEQEQQQIDKDFTLEGEEGREDDETHHYEPPSWSSWVFVTGSVNSVPGENIINIIYN